MNLLKSLAVATLAASAASTVFANEAQVIFHCSSVMLRPAQVNLLGQVYTLSATTLFDGTINDEIGISDDMGSGHYRSTWLMFTDPWFPGEPVPFYCDLDVADPGDSNWNGVSDFFETDHAVNGAKSNGEVYFDDGMDYYEGTVTMTWNRAAGSPTGTCQLQFKMPDFGVDMTFNHPFEILEYRGTLTYQVDGADVHSTMALTRQGAEGSLTGPFELHRIDLNELRFDAAAWTKESGAIIHWYSSTDMEYNLYRGGMGTNYFSVLATEDGMPETAATQEYMIYEIHIYDGNDSDGDKIADLSDETAPPKPPALAIRTEGQKLKLLVTGEAGRRVYVDQTSTLPFADWATLPPITLTGPTQEIEVEVPAVSPAFWRARIE